MKNAYRTAFATESSMAGWKSALPGCTMVSTPAKPATIATQRGVSSFSPNAVALTSAMMIGTEKKIDAVTVSCRYCRARSEEHTSELQSPGDLVCRLLLEKKK